MLDGVPLGHIDRRQLARHLALVEQLSDTTERLSARQVVELGRTPYLSLQSPWNTADDASSHECWMQSTWPTSSSAVAHAIRR